MFDIFLFFFGQKYKYSVCISETESSRRSRGWSLGATLVERCGGALAGAALTRPHRTQHLAHHAHAHVQVYVALPHIYASIIYSFPNTITSTVFLLDKHWQKKKTTKKVFFVVFFSIDFWFIVFRQIILLRATKTMSNNSKNIYLKHANNIFNACI